MAKPQSTSKKSVIVPANYVPGDDEKFMNDRMREYFRRRLLNWKEEISAQTRDTVEYLQGERVNHPDPTDVATYNADRQLELRTKDRLRKLVRKIDKALVRIEDGSYGYCEETGDPISPRRLDARPIATLSLEAQEMHERGERMRAG
ncbi:RNA polymerase-binding protein DksA [Algimonas porphyrae]|uniref:RNA polymerase-binding transcription factor DksA n=1 Tax=Algimonas porphyrae TaxID=1128113 RepID=A0ABQ5V2K0_9PROT|nr:RNA polymerase-binding protein DksA [Algimonas porphyrae]GLQ21753.1 RNA polymerase-binding transcription factor DksA [Algimonas porphyrae]